MKNPQALKGRDQTQLDDFNRTRRPCRRRRVVAPRWGYRALAQVRTLTASPKADESDPYGVMEPTGWLIVFAYLDLSRLSAP